MDWNNPKEKISEYFTVKEALWLPSWDKMHTPTEQEKENIHKTALVMDKIRKILNKPISVHCWIRPELYNKQIGGAPKSAHLLGLAVDFSTSENCDLTRKKLLPYLTKFNIRMECKPGSNWVHIDLMPPKPNRYFIP